MNYEALIESYKSSPSALSFRSFMQKDKIGLGYMLRLLGKIKEWQFS